VEAGRVRVPTGQNYLTPATAGPINEGQDDFVTLATAGLRAGENLLAVEVHQISPISSDIVWGMSLVAVIPEPPVIFIQPVGGNFVIGDTVTLSVVVFSTVPVQ
jgi:hypothetical protein